MAAALIGALADTSHDVSIHATREHLSHTFVVFVVDLRPRKEGELTVFGVLVERLVRREGRLKQGI